MPSSNKTENYGFNLWSGTDMPKKADFNADNLIIDTALKNKATKDGTLQIGLNADMLDGKHTDDLIRFPTATSISIGTGSNSSAANHVITIGISSGGKNTTGTQNTTLGNTSFRDNTTGNYNTSIGQNSMLNNISGNNNTAIGYSAGALLVSGDPMTNNSNVTLLGNGSRCSGDNQIQLGNSLSVPYAYAALQVRSDGRDKINIQEPTYNQLEFILGLRPVQYRQNPRERYFDDVGNPIENDGSLAGKRLHNGFVAQEVSKHADDMGFDFSGFQDHSINGGCDVQSLAYEQIIAPLVGAFQAYVKKTDAIIKELSLRLDKAGL